MNGTVEFYRYKNHLKKADNSIKRTAKLDVVCCSKDSLLWFIFFPILDTRETNGDRGSILSYLFFFFFVTTVLFAVVVFVVLPKEPQNEPLIYLNNLKETTVKFLKEKLKSISQW